MTYTVFALKWRPKSFDEIIGQDHIVATLRNAIAKNRLAHAFLFAGPRGVGKTSTARILAKALNCRQGPTVEPCNNCASCVEINEGRNFDVIEIDGASNTGVDNIRELREAVKFAPAAGHYKIYIIDEAHMLSDSAFNALLKTLEEPPPHVKFIFATTHPDEIIPTILSRCHRFDFRRISAREISGQLEKIARQEKITVDKDVLFAIARSCDGSLRDAESILDQLVSFSQGSLALGDVISVLGLVEQEVLFEITERIIRKDAKSALELFNQVIEQGKEPGRLLENLIEHFRNLMVAKVASQDEKLIDLPKEICQQLVRQAGYFSLEEIFSTFNVILGAQEIAKRLDSCRIPLEIALVKLAHDKRQSHFTAGHAGEKEQASTAQAQAPKELPPGDGYPAGRRDNGHDEQGRRNGAAAGPKQSSDASGLSSFSLSQAQTSDSAPSGPATTVAEQLPHPAASGLDLEQVKGSWNKVIDNLSKVKMSVSTYLNEGRPVDFKNSMLTISFPRNYSLHKESLERQANKETIEKVLRDLLGAPLKVRFTLSRENALPRDNRDDSFIKSALGAFNARLIKEE